MSSANVYTIVSFLILLTLSSSYHQVSCTPARTRNRFHQSDPDLMCNDDILSIASAPKRNWDDHIVLERCGLTHIGYFGSCSNHKIQIEKKVVIPSTSVTTEVRLDKGLGDGRLYLFDSAFVAADHAWGVCEREAGPSSSSSSPTPRAPMVCMLYMPTKLLPTLQKLYFPISSPEHMIQSFEDFINLQTSQTVRFGKIRDMPGDVYSDLLYSAWSSYATDHMKAFCSVLTEADVLGMGDQKLLTAKTGYKDILQHEKWGKILTRVPSEI